MLNIVFGGKNVILRFWWENVKSFWRKNFELRFLRENVKTNLAGNCLITFDGEIMFLVGKCESLFGGKC